MIPVPVRPYHGVYFAVVDAALFEDLVDAFGDVEGGDSVLDGGVCGRRVVPPIFAAAEIEHDRLVLLLVSDEKGKGWHVHCLMAFLHWLHKGTGGNDNIGCGIDD